MCSDVSVLVHVILKVILACDPFPTNGTSVQPVPCFVDAAFVLHQPLSGSENGLARVARERAINVRWKWRHH
jgi:hypothetical protein